MGEDPQWHLNGQLGFLAVLHTWSQQLMDHFHLHCVIPAGALSRDRTRWRPAGANYLFRVESMARLFRAKYLHLLQTVFSEGLLIFPGRSAPFQEPAAFGALIRSVRGKEWRAYVKKPFAGPDQVLEYVGRYTHRVAISNYRIKAIADGCVRFSYRDRDDDDKIKEMTLDADEFIRRFLLHILPDSFMRIRHFGFLSNRYKARNLAIIRTLIGQPPSEKQPPKTPAELVQEWTGVDFSRCPCCHVGTLRHQQRLPPSHSDHDPPSCSIPGDNP
jgi:hypothetical protein